MAERDQEQPVKAEVVQRPQSSVTDPAKLMRFGSMVAATLHEVRQLEVDETTRRRLQELHRSTIDELKQLVSPDLQEELEEEVEIPFGDQTASQSEIRIAQARLIGWLEGLFQGLQASATERMAQQLREARRQTALEGKPPEEPRAPGYI